MSLWLNWNVSPSEEWPTPQNSPLLTCLLPLPHPLHPSPCSFSDKPWVCACLSQALLSGELRLRPGVYVYVQKCHFHTPVFTWVPRPCITQATVRLAACLECCPLYINQKEINGLLLPESALVKTHTLMGNITRVTIQHPPQNHCLSIP